MSTEIFAKKLSEIFICRLCLPTFFLPHLKGQKKSWWWGGGLMTEKKTAWLTEAKKSWPLGKMAKNWKFSPMSHVSRIKKGLFGGYRSSLRQAAKLWPLEWLHCSLKHRRNHVCGDFLVKNFENMKIYFIVHVLHVKNGLWYNRVKFILKLV